MKRSPNQILVGILAPLETHRIDVRPQDEESDDKTDRDSPTGTVDACAAGVRGCGACRWDSV